MGDVEDKENINIDQTTILNQFIEYLKLKQKSNPKKDHPENQDKNFETYYDSVEVDKIVKEFDGGHCHGFSVAYSVFTYLDKLDWWFDLLEKLSGWDGSSNSLNEKFELVNQSTTKTLGELFETAIDYIRYFQIAPINIQNYNRQDDLFNANKNLLEILSNDNELLSINKSKSIELSLDQNNKKDFIDSITNNIDSHIIMLGLRHANGERHACALRFKEGKYYCYNSNYAGKEGIYENLETLYEDIANANYSITNINFSSFSLSDKALHLALTNGNLKLIKHLLAKDSSLIKKFDFLIKKMPLSVQMLGQLRDQVDNQEIIEAINNQLFLYSSLHDQMKQGNLVEIKSLLKQGANLNIINESGETLRQLAQKEGNLDDITALLSPRKMDALMLQVIDNHIMPIIDYQLNFLKPDELNIQDESGSTYLHLIITHASDQSLTPERRQDYSNRAKSFINKMNIADLNIKDENGNTPLHLAAQGGLVEVVRELLEHDVDINIRNDSSFNALSSAFQGENQDIINMLTQKSLEVMRELSSAPASTPKVPFSQSSEDEVYVNTYDSDYDEIQYF
ncbi:ankyrin repeat domain-containing protein [Thiotrichales bacterium 19S9-12]|nr:ankyrin repeat domain-containing protein [Thiotrichales bacterium 19S9-11]MCF6812377.1 ankyrin repeat domain-containing protein [Thiotrichales bacterium 19S9-12]